MAITKVPQKFDVDGREFDTLEEAERYSTIRQARENLEIAQRVFEQALAESMRTADGHLFEFGIYGDYYHVVTPFHSMPYLNKYSYICREWSVREDGETVTIRDNCKKDSHHVPIKELYKDGRNANAALLEARRKWVQEMAQDVEKFAASLK